MAPEAVMRRLTATMLACGLGAAALVGASSLPAAAQVPPPAVPAAQAGETRDDSVVLEELSYEKLLEESLKQAVASYLGDNRFIIQVRVRMSRTGGQTARVVPGVAQPYQPVLTTGLPGTEMPGEDLPGLPALGQGGGRVAAPQVAPPPPGIVPQAPMGVPGAAPSGLRVDKVRIIFVVDKAMKQEERDFLEKIIYQKADLNFARGDSLDIVTRDFPQLPQGLDRVAITGNAVLASGSAQAPVLSSLPASTGTTPGQDPFRWVLIAILTVLSLAVLGLWAMFLSRKGAASSAAAPGGATGLQGQTPQAPTFAGPGGNTAPPTLGTTTVEDTEARKAEREAAILRQELVVMLLEYPDLASGLFRDLLKKEEGARKGAIVLRALGMQSSSRLFTSLSPEEWGRIEAEFPAARDASPEDTKAAIEEAYQAMVAERAAALAVGATRKNSPFAFLEKLDDSQILFILQDEGLKVRALVLSQLPFKRSAALIKKWPAEDQGAIATALGELESIPVTTFQGIADKLAAKAAQAPSFSAVLTDGVNLLVNILDNADSTTEQRILDTLKTQNPTMMRRVKELYLTFQDVVRIPSAVIKDALREMDPATIAVAIRDAEEPLQDAVLNAMADRRRALLMDAMEMLESQPAEPQQVEEARRELVGRIRDLIKQGRFSMKTLAEG